MISANPVDGRKDYSAFDIKEEACEASSSSESASDSESEEIKVSKGLSMQVNYSKVCVSYEFTRITRS